MSLRVTAHRHAMPFVRRRWGRRWYRPSERRWWRLISVHGQWCCPDRASTIEYMILWFYSSIYIIILWKVGDDLIGHRLVISLGCPAFTFKPYRLASSLYGRFYVLVKLSPTTVTSSGFSPSAFTPSSKMRRSGFWCLTADSMTSSKNSSSLNSWNAVDVTIEIADQHHGIFSFSCSSTCGYVMWCLSPVHTGHSTPPRAFPYILFICIPYIGHTQPFHLDADLNGQRFVECVIRLYDGIFPSARSA